MLIKIKKDIDLKKAVEEQYDFEGDFIESMQKSPHKRSFLVMFDDCEQLSNSRNLLEFNDFEKLDKKNKYIFACYNDKGINKAYPDLFKFKKDTQELLEYRFAPID